MATFDKHTPLDRPDVGGKAAVFVPSENTSELVLQAVKNGSGIVGFGNLDGTLTIYYENNRFNDNKLMRWENKVAKAYERMVNVMPTVNRMSSSPGNFDQIGNVAEGAINIWEMDKLLRWLKQTGAMASAPSSERLSLKPDAGGPPQFFRAP